MNWKAMLAVLLLAAFSSAQTPRPPSNPWKDFDFVLGNWTWSGGGQPGQANGTCTFEPDMNGTVLLRKVHLEYPASKDRAAFTHDDLLYVYHDPQDNSLHAIFFDNEDHVIRYAVTVAPGGDSIQFLSDAAPSGTRARMTYTRVGSDSVKEKFELAPPNKPDQFATYVEFVAKKIDK
ncbi:MAG: hypothetical protein WAU58_04635 [Terriglobales bacterium]|jgi:hypothetical protein